MGVVHTRVSNHSSFPPISVQFNRSLVLAKKVASKNLIRQQVRTMASDGHHAIDTSILFRYASMRKFAC